MIIYNVSGMVGGPRRGLRIGPKDSLVRLPLGSEIHTPSSPPGRGDQDMWRGSKACRRTLVPVASTRKGSIWFIEDCGVFEFHISAVFCVV